MIANNKNQQIVKTAKELKARADFIKSLIVMVIILLLGVIVWLVVDLFILEKDSTLPASVQNATKKINPTLTTEVLEVMKDKRHYSFDDLSSFSIFLDDEGNSSGRELLQLIEKSPIRDDLFGTLVASSSAEASESTNLIIN